MERSALNECLFNCPYNWRCSICPTSDVDSLNAKHEDIGYEKGYRDGYAEALEETDNVPDKNVGEWIGVSQTKFEKLFFRSRVFKCSVCGNYLDFDGVNAGRGSANFCPNCGAKMTLD